MLFGQQFSCIWKKAYSTITSTRSRYFSPKSNELIYQPKLLLSTSANVKAQNNPKLFTRPRPIIAIHNWLYTALVNGYHKLDFNLKDFCSSCPLVVEEIVRSLANDDTQHLNEVIYSNCLENLIAEWNDLPQNAKYFLSNLKSNDFHHRYPTIRMRLPEKINPSKELTSFLNVRIEIIFFATPSDIMSLSDREKFKNSPLSPIMKDIKLPVIHNFQFEREVTRGVDDSWKLISCGSFPSANFKFSSGMFKS